MSGQELTKDDNRLGRPYRLTCALCDAENATFGYDCSVCGGPLLVDPERKSSISANPSLRGVWRYSSLLPRTGAQISLGEADTPLVELGDGVTGVSWRGGIYAKLESLNPTLSFKDRAMAVGASIAKDLGLRGFVVASTGNAAVSASAYAAAAGLECRVVVGAESNALKKLDACRAFGAVVEEVAGDYSAAYAIARSQERDGWMNVSTTYRNPILAEGYRSIAFELVEQLGRAPAVVLVPIGAGPLLRGIERGFQDALDCGVVSAMPRLVGVQAARVSPIYHSWIRRTTGVEPVPESGSTVATAIADRLIGYESHADITLGAVERSQGSVLAVDEESIIQSTQRLISMGIWVEPSSATSLAALTQMSASHEDDGPVVLMLTGHGAKATVPSPGL